MPKYRPRIAMFAVSLLMLVASAAIAGCGSSSSDSDTPKKLTSEEIVKQEGPSTVKLSGRYGQGTVSGSGAVIDAKRGLILTNDHVISGVEALTAQIGSKPPTPARVIAQAPCDDVALVQFATPPTGLKAFKVASSAKIGTGDHVSVLGYPATLEDTATGTSAKLTFTDGTVSNADTSANLGPSLPKYPSLIQHQAPVNHGNSGGPLVDDYGQLVGMNTLTGAGSDEGDQTQGQYYAISSDRIRQLLPTLKAGKDQYNYGWTLEPVSASLLNAFYDNTKLTNTVIRFLKAFKDTQGLMVLGVDPGSAAARNHFQIGDYVTGINDTPITSVSDVCDIAASKNPGDHIEVEGRLLSNNTPASSFGNKYTEDMVVPRN